MKYQSGGAFRRALEERLLANSKKSGTALIRLRKMVAFDRFLARLSHSFPNQWYLKGGYALQLRLGSRARTTVDVDILMVTQQNSLYDILIKATRTDLGDWFTFEIEQPDRNPLNDFGGLRVNISAYLDGRRFERFHLDIGVDDRIIGGFETILNADYLSFADIEPNAYECYTIAQHFAEKLHAYTRVYNHGGSSRVKDLVDMFLIAEMENIDSNSFVNAIKETFEHRATHPIPAQLPTPPRDWEKPFNKLAVDVGISLTQNEAFEKLEELINPILNETGNLLWSPKLWVWETRNEG
ncbi:MAG: nucleotidyl transferase AbiEii/AbiGii toxin family protein [Anaerolineaceae bacterium]|nr:nucleotidyl transferase AbiEii/AbiGii toxin family protein [Anaerolineaceae bacterium]